MPGGLNTFFTYNNQCKATLNSAKTITKAKSNIGKAVRVLIEDVDQVDHTILLVTDSNETDLNLRFDAMEVTNMFVPSIVFNLEIIQKANSKLALKIKKACGLENREKLQQGYTPSTKLFELLIGG